MRITEHTLQYTIVYGLQWPDSPLVYGTENMTDLDILLFLRAHQTGLRPSAIYKLAHSSLVSSAELSGVWFKRENRCYACGGTFSPCTYLARKRWFRRAP